MNARPASRTPRRFTIVIDREDRQAERRVWGWSDGMAETGPDTGGDSDGHDQDVVEHERARRRGPAVVPRFSFATVYDPPP